MKQLLFFFLVFFTSLVPGKAQNVFNVNDFAYSEFLDRGSFPEHPIALSDKDEHWAIAFIENNSLYWRYGELGNPQASTILISDSIETSVSTSGIFTDPIYYFDADMDSDGRAVLAYYGTESEKLYLLVIDAEGNIVDGPVQTDIQLTAGTKGFNTPKVRIVDSKVYVAYPTDIAANGVFDLRIQRFDSLNIAAQLGTPTHLKTTILDAANEHLNDFTETEFYLVDYDVNKNAESAVMILGYNDVNAGCGWKTESLKMTFYHTYKLASPVGDSCALLTYTDDTTAIDKMFAMACETPTGGGDPVGLADKYSMNLEFYEENSSEFFVSYISMNGDYDVLAGSPIGKQIFEDDIISSFYIEPQVHLRVFDGSGNFSQDIDYTPKMDYIPSYVGSSVTNDNDKIQLVISDFDGGAQLALIPYGETDSVGTFIEVHPNACLYAGYPIEFMTNPLSHASLGSCFGISSGYLHLGSTKEGYYGHVSYFDNTDTGFAYTYTGHDTVVNLGFDTFYVNGTLHVYNDATWTNSRFFFSQGSKVVVHNGATLQIVGGFYDGMPTCSNCMWQGFEVEDGATLNLSQYAFYPPVIKNAHVAFKNYLTNTDTLSYGGDDLTTIFEVCSYNYLGNIDYSTAGGDIQMLNVAVLDCYRGVHMLAPNNTPLNGSNSYLKTVKFYTQSPMRDKTFYGMNAHHRAHVQIYKVDDVLIQGCEFVNQSEMQYWNPYESTYTRDIYGGVGIQALANRIKVNRYSGTPNTFKGLFYGVDFGGESSAMLENFKLLAANEFIDNHVAVYSQGGSDLEVKANSVNISSSAPYAEALGFGGIVSKSTNNFELRNNEIINRNDALANIGIHTESYRGNTGLASFVRQNDIDGFKYTFVSQHRNEGLYVLCNQFTGREEETLTHWYHGSEMDNQPQPLSLQPLGAANRFYNSVIYDDVYVDDALTSTTMSGFVYYHPEAAVSGHYPLSVLKPTISGPDSAAYIVNPINTTLNFSDTLGYCRTGPQNVPDIENIDGPTYHGDSVGDPHGGKYRIALGHVKHLLSTGEFSQIIPYLDSIGEYYSQWMLVAEYLAAGNDSLAQLTLNAVADSNNLDADRRNYYQFLINVSRSGRNLAQLDSLEVDTLLGFANGTGYMKHDAQAVLHHLYGYVYDSIAVHIDAEEAKWTENDPHPAEKEVFLYPNPASSRVQLHLPLAATDEAEILISNILGVNLLKMSLVNTFDEHIISTANLSTNFYILTAIINGETVFSAPLIVSQP